MATKNQARVMIGGKVLTMGGYESEEYLQRVASYVNRRISELESVSGFGRLSADIQKALIEINIADDYFKAKSRAELLEKDIEEKDREAYDIKRELVAAQMELNQVRTELEKLRKSLPNGQK